MLEQSRAGPSIIAIFAILMLLGLGTAANATQGAYSSASRPVAPASDSSRGDSDEGLSYALLPAPAYLHQQTPAGYSFKEGGALIVAAGDQLQVKTVFEGSAKTAFTIVVQTADQNLTAGRVTSDAAGGAEFKDNVTLQPGTYEVGLLLFVADHPDSPVGVSVPRSIQVTVPGASATSTASSSRTSASSSSSVTPTAQAAGAIDEIRFSPVSASSSSASAAAAAGESRSYPYGEGSGSYAIAGDGVSFDLGFMGQKPETTYSLLLSVNGSSRTVGQYTSDAKGDGSITATSALGPGTYDLGLSVVDSSNFDVPTTVLASIPSSFPVTIHAAPQSASTTTTTNSSGASSPSGPEWTFGLSQSPSVEGVPHGYRFPSDGNATVSLYPGSASAPLLGVKVAFDDANPSTTYQVALVLNGTDVDVGSMTTDRSGSAVLQAEAEVEPGSYAMGIKVYDASALGTGEEGEGNPVLVLVSEPSTQLAVVSPQPPAAAVSNTTAHSSGSSSSSSYAPTGTASSSVPPTTISAGTKVNAQIERAVDNLTILATVEVTPLATSTNVLDSRFSLSVGEQVGNGLAIAISGDGVVGPRVLLINMSKTAPLALYPALNVTLDGVPVAEASSALQVLNPIPGDSPMYVLVSTSGSIQLLVSIPHFSLHLIQVSGVIVTSIVSSLELESPVLAASVLVITLAFVGVYAARKRYFAGALP